MSATRRPSSRIWSDRRESSSTSSSTSGCGHGTLVRNHSPAILAFALAAAGNTAEGLAFVRLAVERDPDAFVHHWIHTLIAHMHGAFEECFAAADRAAEVSNRHHFALAYRTVACADSGRLAEARALHDEMRTKRAQVYVPYFSLAISASAIGDMGGAIEYAQQ